MTTPWKITPMWNGQTVAILAGGPSLTADVAESLRQYRCIAVTRSHRIAPWADMMVALDAKLSLWADVRAFAGMKVCGVASDDIDALYAGPMYEHVLMGAGRRIEIRNSGLAAIRIAAAMGATHIILAGFDPGLAPEGRYEGVAQGLRAIVAEMKLQGIEVSRCVPVQPPRPTAESAQQMSRTGAGARRRNRGGA